MLAGGRERADWVRNVKADAKVTVRIGDRAGDATARVLDPGTDEDTLARRLLLGKYQRPGKQDLVDWAANSLPVAFDLTF